MKFVKIITTVVLNIILLTFLVVQIYLFFKQGVFDKRLFLLIILVLLGKIPTSYWNIK
jgi:hypothetical protein